MRKYFIGVAGIFLLFAIAHYYISLSNFSYRYRLGIEVIDNGEIRSASSVIEVRKLRQSTFLPEVARYTSIVTAEAAFLDLGGGRNLVMLLFAPSHGSEMPVVVAEDVFVGRVLDSAERMRSIKQGAAELTGERIPALVTFGDLADPRTVRLVDPNDFEATFGRGVTFKRAFIELTHAPVSQGIIEKLPWLVGFKGYLGGEFDVSRARPEHNFTARVFIRRM